MAEQRKRMPIVREIMIFVLIFALAVTVLPGGIIQPTTARAYDLTLDVSGGHVVVPSTASDVRITGTYTGSSSDVHHGIYVQPGFRGKITLDNVTVKLAKANKFVAAMLVDSSTLDNGSIDTEVELILQGTSTLHTGTDGGTTHRAGLEIMRGAQVHIKTADGTDTSGKLTAQASDQRSTDDSSGGAGIGAGNIPYSGGNIIISSGTVIGEASYHGAGIGDAWGRYMYPGLGGPASWLSAYRAHQTSTDGKNGEAFNTLGDQVNTSDAASRSFLYNGTILIYGGDVTSLGGAHGSGIGGACYAGTTNGQSTVIVLPPTKITAESGSGRPLVGGAAQTVYFGDENQPAITVRVNDGSANVQNADIYADLSNITIINNAINTLVNDPGVLNPEKIFVGTTGSTGDCQFNAVLADPVTFFTDAMTPNGLNYLAVTGTVPSSASTTFPGTVFTLYTPYLPDTSSQGFTQAQNLTFSYSAADALGKAATLTFENNGSDGNHGATGSYADLKIPDNVKLTFQNDAAASFIADPPITITNPSATRGTVPTTLSGLIGSGYIYKGERIKIDFPLNTDKTAGTYNAAFTLAGQDEAQGTTVTQTFDIIQEVIDSGVSSVTIRPAQHTSAGGSSIITIEGTELAQAVTAGLRLQWQANGSGPSGTIVINDLLSTTYGSSGVLSADLYPTPLSSASITNTKIEIEITLDAQQYYEAFRDDDYTFEAYVLNPTTGSGYLATGCSDTVYVGDQVPNYQSADANPDTLPNGGRSVITLHGNYLYNFNTIELYDVINDKWYTVNAAGKDTQATCTVSVPSMEGVYTYQVWIDGADQNTDVHIATGALSPGGPPSVIGTAIDPAPTNPADKEWTGRGIGHKGNGFTGDSTGLDFLYHHAKQAYLANPGSAVLTLQNIWYITEAQLGNAAAGANDGSKWTYGTVELRFDTLDPSGVNRLEGRLIINPRAAAADIYPVVCTCPNETARTRNLFSGRYPGNKLAVICLTQNGTYGTRVEIMAGVDLSGMDTDSLYLYRYDRETGEYSRMNDANYSIDGDGFLHFFTEYGGDILVTDSPLSADGTAVTTGSFPVDRKPEEE